MVMQPRDESIYSHQPLFTLEQASTNVQHQIMSFSTIPNELVLEIAIYLPARELSFLSSTSHALADLLTPHLLRRATNCDLSRSITLDRPASLRSILYSPTVNANDTISAPDSDTRVWPLHYAAQHSSPEIVAILIGDGVPVDEPEWTRVTTLQCAVLSGSPVIVTLILDAGANIDRISDRNKCAPLILSCENIDDGVANLLIDRGARISAHAMVIAAYRGHITLLERMLDMGTPVDSLYDSKVTDEPVTPLQFLCMFCRRGVCRPVEVFLKRGADVNRGMEGSARKFPLRCAAQSGNAHLVRVLIDFGADREVMFGGKTLAVMAKEMGKNDVFDVLMEYGR